jgi:hypothetical protein
MLIPMIWDCVVRFGKLSDTPNEVIICLALAVVISLVGLMFYAILTAVRGRLLVPDNGRAINESAVVMINAIYLAAMCFVCVICVCAEKRKPNDRACLR